MVNEKQNLKFDTCFGAVLVPREKLPSKSERVIFVSLFLGSLTSEQQARQTCYDSFTCCNPEIEVADQTYLT